MRQCFIDIETASTVPLSAGVDNYSAAATVILMAWALDDGPVQHWSVGDAPPQDLMRAFSDVAAVRLVAHNAAFECAVLTRCSPSWLRPLVDMDQALMPTRWLCTMAQAYAHGLPPALKDLSALYALEQATAKLTKEGKSLIKLFSDRGAAQTTVSQDIEGCPAAWARFIRYCCHDVAATRAVHYKMPRGNYPDNNTEFLLWALDQRINRRGVAIDTDLVQAAALALTREKARLAHATAQATAGQLRSTEQRNAMLCYLRDGVGVAMPDLQAATLEHFLANTDLPQAAQHLLQLRQDVSKTSTAKYAALARNVGSDGRLRNTLQYCGASRTGRWAGRVFQPQNLPRPRMRAAEIEQGIEVLKRGVADLLYPSVMQLASDCLRGVIVASSGKKLVVSDLANIEGRVLAFLANEQWKLQAFRGFDQGRGEDLYALAYARSFGVPIGRVTPDQRQIGKVQELALGYAGGVMALLNLFAAYDIDLDAMAQRALALAPPHLIAQSKNAYVRARATPHGALPETSESVWIACDVIKRAWRAANPNIVALWSDMETAVRQVLVQKTGVARIGPLMVSYGGNALTILLPSGRYLTYANAALKDGVITYQGQHTSTRKWGVLQTYSGKLVENATQAVARDVLAHAMPLLEDKGYAIVLSVHDELITEVPDEPRYSADELSRILATPPSWAKALPLAAKGYEAYRYKKD